MSVLTLLGPPVGIALYGAKPKKKKKKGGSEPSDSDESDSSTELPPEGAGGSGSQRKRPNRTTDHPPKSYLRDLDIDIGVAPAKAQTTPLGFMPGWSTNREWTFNEGLRELIQNWQDGALAVAVLKAPDRVKDVFRDLIMVTNTTPAPAGKMDRLTTIYLNGSKDRDKWVEPVYMLAWMELKFTTTNDISDDNGETTEIPETTLTLYNYCVRLSMDVMRIGETGKKKESGTKYLGGYGEGLKMAVAVMCNEKCRMEIITNEQRWEFYAPADDKEPVNMHVTNHSKSMFKDNMQVIIKSGPSITPQVKAVSPGFVAADALEKLILTTIPAWYLYIRVPDDNTIHVSSGSILLAQNERSIMYVKGIRGVIRSELYFGYDLLDYKLPPDRKTTLVSEDEKSRKTIANIWNEALLKYPRIAIPYADALEVYAASSDDHDKNPEKAAQEARDAMNGVAKDDLNHADAPLSLISAQIVIKRFVAKWKKGSIFISERTPVESMRVVTERMRKPVVCVSGPALRLVQMANMLSNVDDVMNKIRNRMGANKAVDNLSSAEKQMFARLLYVAENRYLLRENELKIVDMEDDSLDVAFSSGMYCIRRVLVSTPGYAHRVKRYNSCAGQNGVPADCKCNAVLFEELLKKEVEKFMKADEIERRRAISLSPPKKKPPVPPELTKAQQDAAEALDLKLKTEEDLKDCMTACQAVRDKHYMERSKIMDDCKAAKAAVQKQCDDELKKLEAQTDLDMKPLEKKLLDAQNAAAAATAAHRAADEKLYKMARSLN